MEFRNSAKVARWLVKMTTRWSSKSETVNTQSNILWHPRNLTSPADYCVFFSTVFWNFSLNKLSSLSEAWEKPSEIRDWFRLGASSSFLLPMNPAAPHTLHRNSKGATEPIAIGWPLHSTEESGNYSEFCHFFGYDSRQVTFPALSLSFPTCHKIRPLIHFTGVLWGWITFHTSKALWDKTVDERCCRTTIIYIPKGHMINNRPTTAESQAELNLTSHVTVLSLW